MNLVAKEYVAYADRQALLGQLRRAAAEVIAGGDLYGRRKKVAPLWKTAGIALLGCFLA
jgi:hypothetical protein